jgi:hypothetical protein
MFLAVQEVRKKLDCDFSTTKHKVNNNAVRMEPYEAYAVYSAGQESMSTLA